MPPCSSLRVFSVLTVFFPLMLALSMGELHAQSGEERDTVPLEEMQEDSAEGKEKEEKVFTSVQQNPRFPGGQDALQKYLIGEVEYPKEAKKKEIEGTVYVGCVVWKDGSIRKVKVRKGVHKLLDEEAVRAVKGMPDWEPGVQKGEAVPVWVSIPINFELGEE